jgi:carbon monoxide dehydrogenase subunit G
MTAVVGRPGSAAGEEGESMKIENSFVVPMPVEQAWPLLLDVPSIAPCLPGAELTEVVGPQHYRGRALLKVGPVALAFEGEAQIVDIDAAGKTARVLAKGSDKKGRGNASATVTFALAEDPAGARVNVSTELNLVGAVAQYGRGAGLLKAIADQLIGQFAANLDAALRGASGEAGAQPAAGKPISGLRLMGGALKSMAKQKFGGGAPE